MTTGGQLRHGGCERHAHVTAAASQPNRPNSRPPQGSLAPRSRHPPGAGEPGAGSGMC